jgi:hypothetical protein
MLPHPVYHSVFQFHNTNLGWTNQCNYYKNACIKRLWQHDFWMKPKNFEVRYPHRQTSMKATIPDTPGSIKKSRRFASSIYSQTRL